MKSSMLVYLFSVFASANAFATPSPIPAARLADYKTAVNLAINQQATNAKCDVVLGSQGDESVYAENDVNSAQTGLVDLDGQQPLLIFTTIQEAKKIIVTVTTSADFKRIVSISDEYFVPGTMNSGDLRNPTITKGYTPLLKMLCTIKN